MAVGARAVLPAVRACGRVLSRLFARVPTVPCATRTLESRHRWLPCALDCALDRDQPGAITRPCDLSCGPWVNKLSGWAAVEASLQDQNGGHGVV